MREERQRLILEGLPKGSLIQRNQITIQRLLKDIEARFVRDCPIVYKSNLTAEIQYVCFNIWTYLPKERCKLEVYQEGDLVVLGFPLSSVAVNIDCLPEENFRRAYSIISKHFPGVYSESEVVAFKNSRTGFREEFEGFLKEFILKIKVSHTSILRDVAYPKYKRRDYVPIVSIDLKSGLASVLSVPYANTDKGMLQALNIHLPKEYESLLGKVGSDAFPRNLIRSTYTFELPGSTEVVHRSWF